jgi:NAD-dependent SIR2 family protein deacetylase
VVLFGENLNVNLMQEAMHIAAADLVFIMGTSLKVFPFNMLIGLINQNTPVVLVNYDDVLGGGHKGSIKKLLFLEGDIDSQIQRVADAAGINLD